VGLLEWTRQPAAVAGLDRLAETVRTRVTDWLGRRLGEVGRAVMDALAHGDAGDPVALGLAAGVLASSDVRAAEARGAFGARYLGRLLGVETARGWAEAARTVVEHLLPYAGGSSPLRRVLARAEELLASVGAADMAEASDVLPAGFAARLRRLAGCCEAVDGPETARATLPAAEDAYERLARHILIDAEPQGTRVSRARMALRLVRWLAVEVAAPAPTIRDAVARHLRDDAWVDRARAHVWAGDADEAVAAAYRRVYAAASGQRERHDHQFADLLASHSAAGTASGGLLHIEDVLRRVLPDLARETPVLMLVVDGMSAAVAGELAEELGASGWVEALRREEPYRAGVLAALPTVTEVSRTSLFVGALTRGGAADERRGLAAWARRHGTTAALFHKADLDAAAAGEELTPVVRAAVRDTQGHRVVAAVLNAVDDSLGKGDPGRPLWAPERVTHLAELVKAAEHAGRAVVLTADHGHVVERRDGERRAYAGSVSARWRPADGPPPGDGEVAIAGPRVLLGSGRVVAAWRETLRYTDVKAGYHGGASAAEAVAPLIVLAHATRQDRLRGWRAAPPPAPGWWYGIVSTVHAAATAGPPSEPEPGREAYLPTEPPAEPVAMPPAPAPAGLAQAVMASATYADQRRRARRGSLPDAEVEKALGALLASGGALPASAFASAVGFPAYRLSGKIAALQRLLNVEGYEVVRHDADAGRMVLDEGLLRQQFGVEDDEEETLR
ncbi:MAG: BREX-2 system phosphatase PglZ, partial [Nocardioidaceae bacterium]